MNAVTTPILVVDDDSGTRFAIEELLSSDDREIMLADSGETALRMLRRMAAPPAAILLDVNMGGMSGLETARLIRGSGRHGTIPIVFMTGMSTDDPVISEAYQLGAVDFLIKPVIPAVLESKVAVFCDLYVQRAQIAQQRDELVSTRDDLERANASLAKVAATDPLTGLANRARFIEMLHEAEGRHQRYGEPYAVAMLDLDRFKFVNDTFGHQAGDRVLAQVSERICGAVRPQDQVARLGGDEFCVLVARIAVGRDLLAFAQRLHAALAIPCTVDGDIEVDVPASIGIAGSINAAGDPVAAGSVMRQADEAMYAAKAGHEGYRLHQPELHADATKVLDRERDIGNSIDAGQLLVDYQPIWKFDSTQMVVYGNEALVRWQHPVQGLLQASKFIDVAERHGLIGCIDRWVATSCCANYPDTARGLALALNCSNPSITGDRYVGAVSEAIAASALAPGDLVVEIGETTDLADIAGLDRNVRALREQGVRIALDVFGCGYSWIDILRRVPIDIVKIERTLMAGLTNTARDRRFLSALVAFAHDLGCQVCAKGIENRVVLEVSQQAGCDLFQGYYLGRPGPLPGHGQVDTKGRAAAEPPTRP